MTFPVQALQPGREIVRIVELVVPRCVLRYGNLPCTAGVRAVDHPNLVQQSQVFSGDSWGAIPGLINLPTRTMSYFVAPNSTLTGVLMVDSDATIYQGVVTSHDISAHASGTFFHASVFILKGNQPTRPWLSLLFTGSAATARQANLGADLQTGVYSTSVDAQFPKVVDCGSWWRFGFCAQKHALYTHVSLWLFPAVASGANLLTDDVATIGSASFWGAMVAANTTQMPPYLARGVESQWLSTGLSQACYNTAQTCQALSAYLQGEQSIYFIDEKVDLPIGLSAFPALGAVSLNPARLNPQAGIAESARLTVELKDFPYDDRGTDPYVDARSYNPSSQGTFFGRFFARDPYIQGKKIRYHEGYYAGSGTFMFSHYLTREFIVDEFDRPDSKGRVRIRGTDILRLTNADRALCPIPSTATLQSNMTAADSAFFMASSAAAAYLASDLHVGIDEELLQLVTQTGCRWTTVRGAGKSEVTVHSAGSLVQVCQTYSYTNVCSIAMDLIVNKALIPSSYIPVNSWDAEKAETLSTYNLYNIIRKPTPVRDLLSEICKTCDLGIWYDETAAKVALRHQGPWMVPFLSLSDSATLLGDTVSIKARDDLKVSRVGIRYAPTNYADGSEFARFQMAVNSSREDPRFDGRKSEYIIETTWLGTSHDSLAATIVGRGMLRYSEMDPFEAQFKMDAVMVGSVKTGAVVELNTRTIQDVDGTFAATRMQVIEYGPDVSGHSYRYSALIYQGLTAATSLAIDVSTYNYNVHSALGGPAVAARVYLTVGSGVVVGGSGTGQASITTSGLPQGSIVYLTLLGSSQVLGYAGARGLGGRGFSDETNPGVFVFITTRDPTAGTQGGAAVYVADFVTVYVDVSGGYLFAGGPGGGGGGIDWAGRAAYEEGGNGGIGQGYTNSGGPTAPETASYVDGGVAAVWGGTASDGVDGTYVNGAGKGDHGYAVKLSGPSAVYQFVGGYDSARVKGLLGV